MARDDNGLCERCFHRHDSRRRVAEFVRISLARGEKPPFSGIACDPAPKRECKEHEGYGREVGTRIECRDFKANERAAAGET